MPNRWYTTPDAIKAAIALTGNLKDSLLGTYIDAASQSIEQTLRRRFIPQTQTRYYRWPQPFGSSLTLFLDQDLLAVTLLQVKAQDASPVTIASTDYFLEPVNDPPYRRIEIDLSSSAAFESGNTTQRSIAVTGRWGYQEATVAAGTLAEDLDASETQIDATAGILASVGNTLLIDNEQMFISGAIGPANFTVVRAVNGTTAATHTNGAAISKYVVPATVENYCRAEAIANFKQGESGWTGQIGGGAGGIPTQMFDVVKLRERMIEEFGLVSL